MSTCLPFKTSHQIDDGSEPCQVEVSVLKKVCLHLSSEFLHCIYLYPGMHDVRSFVHLCIQVGNRNNDRGWVCWLRSTLHQHEVVGQNPHTSNNITPYQHRYPLTAVHCAAGFCIKVPSSLASCELSCSSLPPKFVWSRLGFPSWGTLLCTIVALVPERFRNGAR